MEWMYNANNKGVNPDDYLLGKKIDSAIIESQEEDQEGSSGMVAAVDMANKIREDPLFAIKQKEANKRKALLENPIRLKQLQQMLHSQVGDKAKKSKKKDKKRKKEKKQKKSHRDSSESDEDSEEDDLDAKLMKKLKSQALRGQEAEVQEMLRGPQYGLIGGKSDSRRENEREESKRHPERRRNDDEDGQRHKDGRRNESDDRDGRWRGDDDGKRRRRDKDDERRYKGQTHERSRSRSPARHRKKANKMSEEELERRRREMMDNATWRDDQRKNRVEKYRAEAAKEDEMEKKKKSRKADFFNPLKVTSHSTVEDRIKRNIHNIQRTKADLDKNFAKR